MAAHWADKRVEQSAGNLVAWMVDMRVAPTAALRADSTVGRWVDRSVARRAACWVAYLAGQKAEHLDGNLVAWKVGLKVVPTAGLRADQTVDRWAER